MRIVIIAPGSRGDVQPYVALGKGLKQAGHVARLVTHRNFEDFVNSFGVEFWPIEGNVQDIAQSKEMRNRLGTAYSGIGSWASTDSTPEADG